MGLASRFAGVKPKFCGDGDAFEDQREFLELLK